MWSCRHTRPCPELITFRTLCELHEGLTVRERMFVMFSDEYCGELPVVPFTLSHKKSYACKHARKMEKACRAEQDVISLCNILSLSLTVII